MVWRDDATICFHQLTVVRTGAFPLLSAGAPPGVELDEFDRDLTIHAQQEFVIGHQVRHSLVQQRMAPSARTACSCRLTFSTAPGVGGLGAFGGGLVA